MNNNEFKPNTQDSAMSQSFKQGMSANVAAFRPSMNSGASSFKPTAQPFTPGAPSFVPGGAQKPSQMSAPAFKPSQPSYSAPAFNPQPSASTAAKVFVPAIQQKAPMNNNATSFNPTSSAWTPNANPVQKSTPPPQQQQQMQYQPNMGQNYNGGYQQQQQQQPPQNQGGFNNMYQQQPNRQSYNNNGYNNNTVPQQQQQQNYNQGGYNNNSNYNNNQQQQNQYSNGGGYSQPQQNNYGQQQQQQQPHQSQGLYNQQPPAAPYNQRPGQQNGYNNYQKPQSTGNQPGFQKTYQKKEQYNNVQTIPNQQQKDQWGGWESNGQVINGQEYQNRKMSNPPVGNQNAAASALSVGANVFKPGGGPPATSAAPFKPSTTAAAPFKPSTTAAAPFKPSAPAPPPKKVEAPKPVDKVAEKLKSLDHNDDEIKEFKDITLELKNNGDKPISMELLKKVMNLKISDAKDDSKHCTNPLIVDRAVAQEVEAKKSNKNYNNRNNNYNQNRNNNRNRENDNNQFDKNTAKPQQYNQHNNNNNRSNGGTPWKQEDNEEKTKLREQAKKMHDKVTQSKNEEQKIRLILNIITPDNFVKKFGELRGFLFPGLKTKQECKEEEIEFNEEEHKLTDEIVRTDILNTIVENIFRKAQLEKEYTIFYGNLCEQMITLELQLRDEAIKISNMKNSMFRKTLFSICKDCFEKFFDADEKTKAKSSKERTIIFKLKLYGNLDFVGELYRRKILPEAILNTVFESLICISNMNEVVDDLNTEGAINLMNKVGQAYEANIKATKKNQQEKQDKLDVILNKFRELENLPTEDLITNRTKMLIKNMFDNKSKNWKKTEDQNKGGPTTKAEVAASVQNKYEAERQKRDNEDRGGRYGQGGNRDRRDDRGYNNRDRDNNQRGGGNRDRRDDRDTGKYQKKETQSYQKKGDRNDKYNKDNRRDDRNQDKRQSRVQEQREIIPIDDDKMSAMLKKNFEEFVIRQQNDNQERDPEEEEDKQEKKKEIFDLGVWKKLSFDNGKKADQMFYRLLSQIFDEDITKVKAYMRKYLDTLTEQKVMQKADYSEGCSQFISMMPELSLDLPEVHKYLFNYVIKPLLDKGMMTLRFLKFDRDLPKPEDPDDYVFDNTDFHFRLIALIMSNELTINKKSDLVEFIQKDNWTKIFQKLWAKIETESELWTNIKGDVGEDHASIIIPFLQEGAK